MSTLHPFEPGGYQFLEGGFPYSAGVIAAPGHELVRVRLRRPMSIADGFGAIESHLRTVGRPLTALAAAELRSPAAFSLQGFRDFNAGYVAVLEQWGLIQGGLNPVARSNVCPLHDAPTEPGFFAFSYTVPAPARSPGNSAPAPAPTFVVAGSGEWPEDQPFPESIVARGDTSLAGLQAKAAYVLQTMRARCAGLGGDWSQLTAAQIYTIHDLHPLIASHLAPAGLLANGLSWHLCRPPIRELEYEMDVRHVRLELTLG